MGEYNIGEQFLTAQPSSFSAKDAREQWSCLFLTDRPLISHVVLENRKAAYQNSPDVSFVYQ